MVNKIWIAIILFATFLKVDTFVTKVDTKVTHLSKVDTFKLIDLN